VNNLDNPKAYGGIGGQLSGPQMASTLDTPYNIQLGKKMAIGWIRHEQENHNSRKYHNYHGDPKDYGKTL